MSEAAAPILLNNVLAGDLRALARAATLIENSSSASEQLLGELKSHAGRALLIGVTGPPGTGKSTLCDQMIALVRAEGKKVAVLAVDPSSPLSGGAILGDRIRMQRHHGDPGVFIRSMASRGLAGGLARATSNLSLLLDAAGFDVVVIETVGVGQSEVDVARLAHVTLLVLAPGAGDEVQALKAGIMEVASVFAVNKSDLAGAEQLRRAIAEEAHERPVLLTVASTGAGVAEVLGALRSAPRRSLMAGKGSARIDHLGIAVRSIDGALNFYVKQLGLDATSRETVPQEKVNVAMLPLGESRIELLEACAADSVIAKFVEKHGEGLHHVALRVPDLVASVTALKAAGARILNEPQKGAGGHLYVFVHPSSTGGVLLELIQN